MNLWPTITPEQADKYLAAARVRRAGKVAGWRNAHIDYCERNTLPASGGQPRWGAGQDRHAGISRLGGKQITYEHNT